jgi:hypothetical protein
MQKGDRDLLWKVNREDVDFGQISDTYTQDVSVVCRIRFNKFDNEGKGRRHLGQASLSQVA